MNIIPVIGVDYSLANLTFGTADVCIHTLKDGAANDYMDCLKSVSKCFNWFSRFMVPLGFGARTILKGDGPACNLFAMTGDFFDPYVSNTEELLKCYEGTIKSEKLALPVYYQAIFKFVCDTAA